MNETFNRSILIVEDDEALCGYLASSLVHAGYQVALAHNATQCRKVIKAKGLANLVLLDLGLPPHPSSMTEGLGLLEEILHVSPGTKVIVLTGQDESAAALQAVRRGAFDFLVKPAPLARIFSALNRAELFAREDERLAQMGEARLQLTARLGEGPKEAASSAEEQLLRRVLDATHYNMTDAARRLGIAREHVYYYLNKYGIQRPA
jgi:two-component system, response regulator RegA